MNLDNDYIISLAKKYGFDLVGFSAAEELRNESERLKDWLDKGYNAGMDYMKRNFEKRKNVKKILPEAKSVISLGMNYYSPEKYENKKNTGKVSRYAWGKDYHYVIWDKLDDIIDDLKAIEPKFDAISYIDTGPVMDKAWAVKSGLGWLGKHTNVINKNLGSWFFIANIITNWNFNYSHPIEDFCGSCTACLDACPTNAIIQEYVVDSNKCISYLTIENKKEIPDIFKDKFDNWLFGCDICQDVCPWNIKFSSETYCFDFYPKKGNKQINLTEIKSMTKDEFEDRFKESPIQRTKLSGLKRNADFLIK
jgi:epoxyqueuosine reductase